MAMQKNDYGGFGDFGNSGVCIEFGVIFIQFRFLTVYIHLGVELKNTPPP